MSNEIKNYIDIKKTIWCFLDILRSNNLLNNFNLTAFILFLKRENILDKISWRFQSDNTISVNDAIRLTLSDFHNKINGSIANNLANIFARELDLMDKFTLMKICDLLDLIDNKVYQEYAAQIIDEVYLEIAQRIGKRSETFIQPIEITELINSIANLPVGARIYNPFAGLASYGVGFSTDNQYYGQELNRNIWALGIIRLLAHNVKTDNYVCEDSISNWKDSYPVFEFFQTNRDNTPRFDLIVSTPPFGLHLNRIDYSYEMENIRSIEEFLLIKGLRSLSPTGKMILVVPRGFLSSGSKSSLDVRKNLIKNDALEMVMSLPTGIFYSTNIATSILVINKNKQEANVVKFVNAEDCYTLLDNNKQLDTQSILSQITTGFDSNIAKTTSIHEIKVNDFNLNPNIYFKKDIDVPPGFEMKELRVVLAKIKRITNHNDSNGRFVQISDLANDVFDYERSYSDTNITPLKKNAVKLNKNALLISKVSLNLKPTHFVKLTDYPIYLSLNIEAFEIKDKSVIMPYLIHELYEDYFQTQLNSFVSGSVIASVSTENFLSCKILVPSLEKQKAIVVESRKQLILEKENELKSLRAKFEQQTYEEFASLKHALGKPIPGIATAIEYIYEYLQKNEGSPITLNDIVSNRRKTTLQDKFNVVNNGLKLIQTLLQKGDNGLVIENYPLQSFKIVRYIKDFCKSYSSDKFLINIFDNNEECNDIEISTNKELITILLNDVLSNANNHAFTDFDLEKNKVDIFISVIENHLHLLIANNGTPFPKDFDQLKFVQKYQKAGDNSGAGIGGYDINRITQYFNGTFNLITEPMDGYNTIYQFKFTVLDLKEEVNE
jgi:type I restriction enzyme M protein